MKLIVVLFAVIYCLTVVSGRNVNDIKPEDENSDVELDNHNDHSQLRHRRRSRQSFYDPYFNPFFYDNRRDDNRRNYYNRQQEELLSKILNEIEELSSYIRRPPPPPPPPQIIYVPVPYAVPQNTPCSANQPNFTVRWPEVDDQKQIWGQVTNTFGNDWEKDGDGSRPVNLNPLVVDEDTVKPPPVEHGSTQAGMTTLAPPSISKPGKCKAAILVCCQYTTDDEKQDCFSDYGCTKTYSTRVSCHKEVLKRVIAEFAESYAPVNKT